MLTHYWHERRTVNIYPLTVYSINTEASNSLVGTYQLGCLEADGSFRVLYVGRTTTGIKKRLQEHLGEFPDVTHFSSTFLTFEKEAYEQKCIDYHHFKEEMETAIYNDIHPARPAGTDYPCPVEDCTELD